MVVVVVPCLGDTFGLGDNEQQEERHQREAQPPVRTTWCHGRQPELLFTQLLHALSVLLLRARRLRRRASRSSLASKIVV